MAQTSKISKEIAALKEIMVKQREKLDQILVMNQKILNLLGDLDKGNSSTITTENKVYNFFRHFLLDIFSDFLLSQCNTKKVDREYVEYRLYWLQRGPLNWGEIVRGRLSRLPAQQLYI